MNYRTADKPEEVNDTAKYHLVWLEYKAQELRVQSFDDMPTCMHGSKCKPKPVTC